jgi:esterase/lipase superfamily enzyme
MAEIAFSKQYNNREFHQQIISDDTIFNNSVKYFRDRNDILRQFKHQYDIIIERKCHDLDPLLLNLISRCK